MSRLKRIAADGVRRRIGIVVGKVRDLAVGRGELGRTVGRYDIGAEMRFARRSPEGQEMIPDHLETALWDRKGNSTDGSFNAIGDTSRGRVCSRGVAGDIFIDPLGRRGGSVRRVHIHAVIGKFGEQRLGPLGELAGVDFKIGAGDRENRLFARKWIGPARARLVSRYGRCIAAVPSRYGSLRVAGALGTHRRELCR